jgi:hypothetical protein
MWEDIPQQLQKTKKKENSIPSLSYLMGSILPMVFESVKEKIYLYETVFK